jgi:plastocyanin domain-containing protein
MKKMIALVIPLALAAACKKDDAKAKPSTPEAAKPEAPKPSAEAATPSDGTRFEIKVTEKGFEPEDTTVPAGKPVTLVFERKTEKTCAKEVILTMDDGKKIEKELPMNTPVEIAATFPKAGKLGYACGMDMIKGTVVVQ